MTGGGDDWRPSASRARLASARRCSRARGILCARGVLEVDTPLLVMRP